MKTYLDFSTCGLIERDTKISNRLFLSEMKKYKQLIIINESKLNHSYQMLTCEASDIVCLASNKQSYTTLPSPPA